VGSVTKRGNTWAYIVDLGRDPVTGKRRQKWVGGFGSREEAERAFDAAVEANAGNIGSDGSYRLWEAPSHSTLSQFFDRWIEAQALALRPTTIKSYSDCFGWHVRPHLGHLEMRKITAPQIQSLYLKLMENGRRYGDGGLSPTTVRYVHRVLKKMFSDGIAWGVIPRTPMVAVVAPRVPWKEMQVWPVEEVRRFLRAVKGDQYYAMWVLMVLTGLRRGEVAGLKWSDIDLDTGHILIVRTRVAVGWHVELSEPKTKRSRRTVVVDRFTIDALRAHHTDQGRDRLALGDKWPDTGFVFCREDGYPVHPMDITNQFRWLSEEAGVPRIRLHDLRHTAATLALKAGVHPKIVSGGSGTPTSPSPSTSTPTWSRGSKRRRHGRSSSSSPRAWRWGRR
jgi:integrase